MAMIKKLIIVKFTMAIIMVIVFSSCTIAESVYAQSTKPSPPKFTIQIPNNSTIQLVVENQAFTNSSSVNSIVYYYRVKDHFSEQWILNGNYQLQSNSQTTLITIPPHPSPFLFDPFMYSTVLNNSTLLDFQVQAKTGYYAITQKPGYMPGMPPIGSGDGYSEITFNPAETSDWSITQAVNLNQTSTTSTTPTVPEFSVPLTITFLIMVIVALAAVVKRRKKV
jgi:hypothetical protein